MIINSNPLSVALKSKLFRGFADPSRLSILESLFNGPLNVGEIVSATGLSQSNASNHLSCLKDCGLIASEQQGRYVVYRLSDPRVARLLRISEELLADVAKGVYECTRYPDQTERL
jgi:ArsR family transcriptional regulator, cadmium/lead-responsive transcriptional repressor